MRSLYWFQTDLRLQDNPGLLGQAGAKHLLLVYLWPRNRPWCNLNGMGEQRQRFLTESLQALRNELSRHGQDLIVLQGSPELVIPDLVREYEIDRVSTSRAPGYHERQSLQFLTARLGVPLDIYAGNTLFSEEDLPGSLDALPGQFTLFRKAVASQDFTTPKPAPHTLPPPPSARFDRIPPSRARPHTALPIRGGTAQGQRRLRQFVFEQRTIDNYKNTRNGLDPLDGSSTLSPWLANGCLSARQVAAAIRTHEDELGRNASTEWLYFELLWREFFHWRALRDDVNLFRLRPQGARRRVHNCTFEPRSFARWCQGDTDYPLVNALMHQLVATGWMSNRGRQIAASCLVNELGLDWRYGAAFFEKHLLDYDVASNYGNWQYLAGAGADPRGGRHFDLDKQTSQFDPDGLFTEKWGGYRPAQPEYVTDAADWPLSEP